MLALDSLDIGCIAMELEELFKIRIPEEELDAWKTPRCIIKTAWRYHREGTGEGICELT